MVSRLQVRNPPFSQDFWATVLALLRMRAAVG